MENSSVISILILSGIIVLVGFGIWYIHKSMFEVISSESDDEQDDFIDPTKTIITITDDSSKPYGITFKGDVEDSETGKIYSIHTESNPSNPSYLLDVCPCLENEQLPDQFQGKFCGNCGGEIIK